MDTLGIRRATVAIAMAFALLGSLTPVAAQSAAGSPRDARQREALAADPTCFGLDTATELVQLQELRDVSCYHLEVPLQHEAPDQGSAQLAVAVLQAVGEPTGPPILKLTGGPGEPAIPVGLTLFGLAAPVTLGAEGVSRDVILLDQRGTGYSQPNLDCPEIGAGVGGGGWAMSDGDDAETFLQQQGQAPFLEAVQSCRDRLAAVTDLGAFTTINSARDVEALRVALGEDQLTLYGTSYGSKLAQRAMALFPDSWDRVILSSPVPSDANFIEDLPTSYDEALVAVDAVCDADPRCTFTDLLERASAAIVELAESPVTVTAASPLVNGASVEVTLTANLVASGLYRLHYLDEAPIAPLLDALGDRNWDGVALTLSTSADGPPVVSAPPAPVEGRPLPSAYGMQLSNICAEEFAYVDPQAAAANIAAASPLAQAFAAAPFSGAISAPVCAIWDVPAAPASTYDQLTSDIPTFVVGAAFDQITPASYVAQAIEGLSAAEELVVPDGVHAPLIGLAGCGGAVISSFLDSATNTTCAEARTATFDAIVPVTPVIGAERLAGPSRYATAAATSRYTFPGGAPLVLVASGENFADALSGGAAAGSIGAPLLLTAGQTLPPETAAELARLQPQQVVIIGGPAAVSSPVFAEVRQASGADVGRVYGPTRFDTAARVADLFFTDPEAVWLTTGQDFPDALSAGAAAATSKQPVLLVGEQLPESVAEVLGETRPSSILVVGGQSAVSSRVAQDASRAAGQASLARIAGENRFETSAAVAETFPVTGSRIAAVVVEGGSFADALSATSMAAGRAPLLLVGAQRAPTVVEEALADRLGSIVAVGGEAVLPDQPLLQLVRSRPPVIPVVAPE